MNSHLQSHSTGTSGQISKPVLNYLELKMVSTTTSVKVNSPFWGRHIHFPTLTQEVSQGWWIDYFVDIPFVCFYKNVSWDWF